METIDDVQRNDGPAIFLSFLDKKYNKFIKNGQDKKIVLIRKGSKQGLGIH